MPQVIASTYEILEKIGAGGGGIVYLGRHLRLGKLVVLKADKRTLSARPEALRREVDALKNLSHTYIPQVYDFVAEDGVVYTVMDYIEGESLDKPLKRGERFTQAQVVKWACQLLEALCYLHSRPPHGILHSDIKPANIMLTPEDEICLIDFNIALALGEEGAVKVGFSQGYASPEHYGQDFTEAGMTQGVVTDASTQLDTGDPGATVLTGSSSGSGSTMGRRSVMLDVRSDIYSLGATLYHLITGHRPELDARNVVSLSGSECSPAVAAIINKAMAPNPDQRYQTAADMLRDFEQLHDRDPRAIRRKRCGAAAAGLLAVLFLAGGCMTFTGLKQMESTQRALALSEYSTEALRRGDVNRALDYALEALPEERSLLDGPVVPQAQAALTDALGVYDLSDGFKSHLLLELPGAPIKVKLAPSGKLAAVMTSGLVHIFRTADGEKLAELPAEKSALADLVFSADDILYYASPDGLCAYHPTAAAELWKGEPATAITLSGDGSVLAAVYRDESTAQVYDARSGQLLQSIDFPGKQLPVLPNDVFADPEDDLFELNGSGSWLAVGFDDGSVQVFDLTGSGNDVELLDPAGSTHFEGGFSNQYLAISATTGDSSLFAAVDLEQMEQTGGFESDRPFHTQADASGIYLSLDNLLVRLDPVTGEQVELAYPNSDIVAFARSGEHTFTANSDDSFSIYDRDARLLEQHTEGDRADFIQVAGEYALVASRDVPALRVLHLERHGDAQLFTYDDSYAHDEARLSADGKNLMFYRFDRFLLYSANSALLLDQEIPDAEEVYDQQFRRKGDDSFLEVFYNDGTIRRYSASDGSLMEETTGPVPDGTLDEEFLTDHWKIISPLHGHPTICDRESGEILRTLETDSYLAYATQVEQGVVAEYISAQGERFAHLLDQQGEVIARLPDLCDITPDGMLIFDDGRGNLRQSRIYALEELLSAAKRVKEELQ